jgi:predicted nucleic acid-binding protein
VQPVILDTDVASLSHKRKLADPLATRLIGRRPLITFVTFGELAKWAEIRHWGNRNRQALADWLSGIPVLPGDEPVAAMWGRLSAATRCASSAPNRFFNVWQTRPGAWGACRSSSQSSCRER